VKIFMLKNYSDDAFTGLELVFVTAIVISATAFIFFHGEKNSPDTASYNGIVYGAMQITGGSLRQVGEATGYAAIDTSLSKIPVRFQKPDRNTLGALEITVSLLIGDMGGIDMDKTKILWMTGNKTEELSRSAASLLVCPGWTISGKYAMLPGRSADTDNILEPGEQFALLMCPAEGAAPYQQITVAISPQGDALPLPVRITTPARIKPVMLLD
jgi:archaellin